MNKDNFNPDSAGVNNGNYFGLPFSTEETRLVLLGIPWDVTVSYRSGTSEGPEAILKASLQVDLFDPDFGNIWEKGIATLGINKSLKKKNAYFRAKAKEIIKQLENGADEKDPKLLPVIREINMASVALNEWVYTECWKILEDKKIPGIVGGEHSVPYGLFKALCEFHDEFGILQIDAHADLREAYESFEFSHASIMYNAMNLKSVKTIVQVGLRDYCETEKKLADSSGFIHRFDANRLFADLFQGKTWDMLCGEIISLLPDKLYISFDIDGLDVQYCPGTGTPVPGGLTFQQISYLFSKIASSGKEIIGFDLCEVCPGKAEDLDAITGARVLYKLCGLALSGT